MHVRQINLFGKMLFHVLAAALESRPCHVPDGPIGQMVEPTGPGVSAADIPTGAGLDQLSESLICELSKLGSSYENELRKALGQYHERLVQVLVPGDVKGMLQPAEFQDRLQRFALQAQCRPCAEEDGELPSFDAVPKKPTHGGHEKGDESLEDPWMPCVTKASSSTSGVQSVEVDIPSPVSGATSSFSKRLAAERRKSRTSSDDTRPPLRLQLMGLMETFETTRVDCIMGILVVLNSIVMALELECDGQANATFVGLTPGWNCAETSKEAWFLVLEHIFTWIFALELVVRLYFLRWAYFRDILNCVDVLLVALPMLDLYVFTPLAGYSHNIELLRVLRLAKMVRAIRIMRTLRLFQGLRLLVQACSSFLPSLAWSMILLAVCMIVGGLVMGNLLQEFIKNEHEDVEARLWIWTYYGTAYRAMYTMHLVLHTFIRLRSCSQQQLLLLQQPPLPLPLLPLLPLLPTTSTIRSLGGLLRV
ncbi:Catsper1 [Symbiodinium sp. CCMP2456]|nr:Catsper1 [Symbiodinium sp. CCMP2456]